MAQDPFELQPQQPPLQAQTWGGMPQLTPQEGQPEMPQSGFGGLQGGPEGSYFQLGPEAMQMMWAPQTQPGLMPQVQPQQQPPPPQINPLV